MMRISLLICLFFPLLVCAQQQFPGVIRLKAVDKKIRFRGKLQEAYQWKDKLGDNLLVTSILGPYEEKSGDEGAMTIELFAVHYLKSDTVYRALWRVNDIVKNCVVDHELKFIKGSTTITDLDKDGIAETKLQYTGACRGDVSPSSMKLIMHEDSVKYALRGEMWVWAGGEQDSVFRITEKNVNLETNPAPHKDDYEWAMGRYQTEKDFAKAPPEFLLFARREWLKYAREKFD